MNTLTTISLGGCQPRQQPPRKTNPNTSNTLLGVVEKVGEEAKNAGNFFVDLFMLLSGLFVTGAFGLGKSLAPDNTFVDKFALVGVLGGVITAAFGGIKIYNRSKAIQNQNQNQQPAALHTVTVSKDLRDRTIDVLGTLYRGNQDFNLAKEIVERSSHTSVQVAKDLLDCYFNKEFTDAMIRTNGDFYFENVDSNDTSASASQIKERIVLLLAYLKANNETTSHLGSLDVLEAEDRSKNLIYMLPPECRIAYKAARAFRERALPAININTLKIQLESNDTTMKENAETEIDKCTLHYNYLKLLKEAIIFIEDAKKTEKSALEPERAKKAILIGAALTAGLGLDGENNINERIAKTLTALDIQISTAQKTKEELETMLQESNKYTLEKFETEGDERFYTTNLELIKLKQN